MKIGFVGGSYTSRSTAVADEECINFFYETTETISPKMQKQYDGTPMMAQYTQPGALFWTPGLKTFAALPETPVRGQIFTGTRMFAVAGASLYEVMSDGTNVNLGAVAADQSPASLAFSNIELLIVSGGHAYDFNFATNLLTEVTGQLEGIPQQVEYSDGYFIVSLGGTNKFQISNILDGTTWQGIFVNAVSVFPENIVSIKVNHRELWVFGSQHCQPYQDTGSSSIFDPIPGALMETGSAAILGPCLLDNSVFWIDESVRGGRSAWRANGYTPQRISTYAVETDLATYADISGMVTYAYQDQGHTFWTIYIPGAQWTWCYDVAEGIWHKRAAWNAGTASFGPHKSWNHVYAWGMNLVGDWSTGNIYEMSTKYLDENGTDIRRLRRSPTIENEMDWIYHQELTVDFDTGLGLQPPLLDGDNAPRAPYAMLRWSDDRGKTWSNVHMIECGFAGQYDTRVVWRRLGRSRYRVYELSVTDPIPWVIVGANLKTPDDKTKQQAA
jgi:hypothetical protein